ncbi:MAG: Mut7-C RNAse domain-containing protein [Promethearchaeota archaeon]
MRGISHRLLVDAMFGKLGRFLRLLGIDTLIADSAWSDTQLLAQARETNRVLITRDRAFYQRTQKFTLENTPPPHDLGLYLADQDLETNLTKIFIHFGIHPENYLWELSPSSSNTNNDSAQSPNLKIPFVSRCTACNAQVTELSRDDARTQVPEGTINRHNQFWFCSNSNCGKVYWRGSHWNDIHAMLVRVADNYARNTRKA